MNTLYVYTPETGLSPEEAYDKSMILASLQGIINKIISYGVACRQNSRYEYDNNSSPTPFPIVVHHNHHFPYCELPRYNAFAQLRAELLVNGITYDDAESRYPLSIE